MGEMSRKVVGKREVKCTGKSTVETNILACR